MFIFSNLATSIDGKIATYSREFFPLGTPYDRKHMMTLRKKSDIILMGASTIRMYKKPCLAGKSGKQPINAIVSNALDGIEPSWEFFQDSRIQRVLFVGAHTPETQIKRFAHCAEVIVLNDDDSTVQQIVDILQKKRIRRLLIEGGGNLMWDFVSENLIDEYHVTLTPRVLGGLLSPTLVDGKGFTPEESLSLSLIQNKKIGDELYLVYRRKKLKAIPRVGRAPRTSR